MKVAGLSEKSSGGPITKKLGEKLSQFTVRILCM